MAQVIKKATRESFGMALCELAKTNKDIIVFDADLAAATKTGIFKKEFPERFFDCGIAEGNMVGVAAGMAAAGKIPVAASFAMFATGRAFEQIRNSVAYPHLNVKIAGSHAGISTGEDGATHQCLEDIVIMRTFRVWWSVAAAVVFLVIGLSFYMSNYISSEKEGKTLIQPGTQQAQLTLSDGSVIDVHRKEVSVVVDGVQVKYKKGVLSYQPTVTTQHEEKNIEEQSGKSNELVIPRGGENTVILADGTTVHLNAGSKLTYPVRFAGKRRIVRLEGEAYFDVAGDENHPFVVQTHLGEITVLGTEFNVNAYADTPVCYTTLVHGKVKFSTLNAETVTLSPGEQAVVFANSSTKRKVDLEEYVGWVDGMYIFNDRPLGDIMKTFERWYDIQVYYETPNLRDIYTLVEE